MSRHYDVGVVGCWYWGNYGSLLNGYATYKILTSFGLDVLNIVTPNNGFEPHAKKFFKAAYPVEAISAVLPFEKLGEYNKQCDTFVTGSDQIWNNLTTLPYSKYFHLDFVSDEKNKVSFATSFGSSVAPVDEETQKIHSKLLQRYSAISVREDTGIAICKKYYGVRATQLMEPVLDVDMDVWKKLADHSEYPKEKEPYLLAYILDPTAEKANAIKYYANKLGVKYINVLDGFSGRYEYNKGKLNLSNTLPNITCYDLLKFMENAEYIISDSFHGTAFAIAYNKPFISITNMQRGISRFQTLLGKLNLMNRLVDDKAIPHNDKFLSGVDYEHINQVIRSERKRATDWLKNAIEGRSGQSVILPKNIVNRLDKDLCMGCGACVSTCPTGALSLQADEYGYYRSSVDMEECVDCGRCIEKCAALNLPHNLNARRPLSYAFVCKDKDMLMGSASGGAFPVLAKEAIRRGGIVVGAAWADNLVVKHIIIEKIEDISKLQKSKYLQSFLGDIFNQIKAILEQGRFVMFTGCPCQVTGLKKYLGKKYSNLLLVDLFCAGCPSQWIFDKYIDSRFSKDKVSAYQFREKNNYDKLWDAYTYSVTDLNGEKTLGRTKENDYYNQLLMLAGSHCRKCFYEGITRYGDLSIGDCWGIQNYDRTISPAHGVSAILVNNEKGEDYLSSIPKSDIEVLKPEPLDQIKKYNVCAFQENRNWPINVKREEFYRNIKTQTFADAMNAALKK